MEGTLEVLQKWEGGDTAGDVSTDGQIVVEEEEEEEEGTEEGGNETGGAKKKGSGNMLPLESESESEGANLVSHSAEELRAMSLSAIEQLLETKLHQVSSQGPAPLPLPIDRNTCFAAFGLDSMTVVQFKGVIENRCVYIVYHIYIYILSKII
jgi:hypothetical protein